MRSRDAVATQVSRRKDALTYASSFYEEAQARVVRLVPKKPSYVELCTELHTLVEKFIANGQRPGHIAFLTQGYAEVIQARDAK